jgi:hypothetical protein
MVKTLAQKVKQVEGLEPLKPVEVEVQSKKKVVYFIIKMEYEYEPKPSIRVINKK